MRILFDSRKEKYKSPFGCIRRGEKCVLSIDIPQSCKTSSVRLCIFDEIGFRMLMPFYKVGCSEGYEFYKTEFALFHTGLYFYYFKIETEESNFSLYKQGSDTNIEAGDLWQITCYDENYDTPEEFKGRVMYQIFPDRFSIGKRCSLAGKLEPFTLHDNTNDIPRFLPDENGRILNNDFYGGNLDGIRLRLPYIKELGVGVIYLNPIFMAYSNHRYDTANYMKVDPMLGTEEDFKNLCAEAHAMDIKIILDGVFSHTGSNSIYFDKNKIFGGGAYSDENSQYKSWYTFEKYSGKYTSWWGIDTLPCVNELDSTYMDYIIREKNSVVEHWLKAGADGFRLDVVDEIPDEFVSILRKQIKKIKPGALLIGEVWEDASNKISYGKRRKYFADSELDSVMNYPFRESIIGYVKGSITGTNFKERIMTIVENYPRMVVNCLMNVLSTHDTRRVLTEFGDDGKTRTKAEKAYFRLGSKELERALAFEMLAVLIQFTLPGMPCIYYGDEIGMEGYEDPLNRCFFSWDKVNENLRGFYAKLAKIKNENLPLKIGNVYFRACGGNSIEFVREYEGNRVVVKAVRADWEYKGKDTLFTLKTPYASAIIYKE